MIHPEPEKGWTRQREGKAAETAEFSPPLQLTLDGNRDEDHRRDAE
jgi:hypothetical protein